MDFLGHRNDVWDLMQSSAVLLAPDTDEAFGLSVVEAMARGLPVVAAGSGGHLETVGSVPGAALFRPGDPEDAARLLRDLAGSEEKRDAYGARLQALQREQFTVDTAGPPTDAVYRQLAVTDLVVVSLEAWDGSLATQPASRLTAAASDPDLRVLFVEPPADPLHDADAGGRRSGRGLGLDRRAADGGCGCSNPRSGCPAGSTRGPTARLSSAVRRAAGRVGSTRPVLWINDPLAADLLRPTGWPALYDITDDWLLADRSPREHDRLVDSERYLLDHCRQVVVCSPRLLETKRAQNVTLIQNAVDVDAYLGDLPRPGDLPAGPVVLYVGTLHRDRLDVDLCVDARRVVAGTATFVLVGPVAARAATRPPHRRREPSSSARASTPTSRRT